MPRVRKRKASQADRDVQLPLPAERSLRRRIQTLRAAIMALLAQVDGLHLKRRRRGATST